MAGWTANFPLATYHIFVPMRFDAGIVRIEKYERGVQEAGL